MKASEYFIIDQNGNEMPYGRYRCLGLICHGWLQIDKRYCKPLSEEYYGDCWFLSVTDGQIIPFPLKNHIANTPDELERVNYYRIDENGTVYNTRGVWSMAENKAILSACYAAIDCHLPNEDVYWVKDSNGHYQLRGVGDVLIKDFGAMPNVYKFRYPSTEDPILILSTTKKKQWRAFDIRTGKQVGPPFRAIGKLREEVRYMRTPDERHLFVDKQWNPVVELPYAPYCGGVGSESDPTSSIICQDGCIAVECEDTSYLLNLKGEMVIPPKRHKYIFPVGANRLLVSKGKLFALADMSGNLLTDFLYKTGDRYSQYNFYSFSENRLAVEKQMGRGVRKTGFIDTDGKEVIPFIYDMVSIPGHFSHGYTVVGIEREVMLRKRKSVAKK